MSNTPGILNYFGDEPRSASLAARCMRLLGNLIVFIVLAAVLIVRAALLLAGYACVFAGTLLLTLGGRRSAAEKLAQWRKRAAELMKLWIADLLRPLRRTSSMPQPVLPV